MLLRLSFLLILFNAFLVSSKLPDGLFSAKEVGLYFSAALVSFFAVLIFLLKKEKKQIKLLLLDWLTLGYLCLLPLIHMFIFDTIAMSKALTQMAYGFAYLSIRIICTNVKQSTLLSGLTEIIVLILGFQLTIATAQYAGVMPSYYPRFGPTGMFFNPGPFAIFISSLLVFIAPRAFNSFLSKQYLALSVYTTLFILGSFFVFFSLSRSAWIGLSIGLLVSAVYFIPIGYRTWLLTNRKILFKAALGIVLLLFPIGYWLYQIKAGSADGRILVWLSAIELISENGLIGVGIGNFAPVYVHYQASFLNSFSGKLSTFSSIAGDSRYAFNDLLQIFSESGIIGFVLFILIIAQVNRLLLKESSSKPGNNEKVVVISGVIGAITVILTAGLTSYPLQMIPISLIFWIFIAVFASLHEKNLDVNRIKQISTWVVLFALTFGIFIYTYYGLSRTEAYLHWMKERKKETGTKKLTSMQKYYPILNDYAEFLFSYATLYADEGDYNNAIKLAEQALNFSPAPAYYYSLGSYYEKVGKHQVAIKYYRVIRSAIPNLLTPRYLEAKSHLHKSDTLTFLSKAKEVLDFQPKIYNQKVKEMRDELASLIAEYDKPQN